MKAQTIKLSKGQLNALRYLNERPFDSRDGRCKEMRITTTNALEKMGLVKTNRYFDDGHTRRNIYWAYTSVTAILTAEGRKFMASIGEFNIDAYAEQKTEYLRLKKSWAPRNAEESARWAARLDNLKSEIVEITKG